MNEAELAQVLGEAMRVYSYQLKSGVGLKPFKTMLKSKPAVVQVRLQHGNLVIEEPIVETRPVAPIARPVFYPEVKPHKKERPHIVEDSYSKRT